MNQHDTPKQTFLNEWPGGYRESWCGDNLPLFEEMVYKAGIAPYASKNNTALEVGCGRGLWTMKYLCPLFAKVVAIDLLPAKEAPQVVNLIYVEAPDRDFSCYGVPDNSVDFVFCYGCFPHLSGDAQAEYLRSMFRVLKPGGYATVNFANYPKRANSSEFPSDPNFRHMDENHAVWFYCDMDFAWAWAEGAGFIKITNLLPENYRDTLLSMRKPTI